MVIGIFFQYVKGISSIVIISIIIQLLLSAGVGGVSSVVGGQFKDMFQRLM